MYVSTLFRTLLVGLIACSFVSQASAQPKQFLSSSKLTFDDLVQAKIVLSEGKPQVQVMVQAYQSERTTQLEPESRIRLDTADGKTLLLKFNGPRRTELKNVVTAVVPVGLKPVNIPVNEARFFRLDGEKVSVEDASKILAEARPIFLREDASGDPPKLPDLYKQALDRDCLILMTRRKVREIKSVHTVRSGPPRTLPESANDKFLKSLRDADRQYPEPE